MASLPQLLSPCSARLNFGKFGRTKRAEKIDGWMEAALPDDKFIGPYSLTGLPGLDSILFTIFIFGRLFGGFSCFTMQPMICDPPVTKSPQISQPLALPRRFWRLSFCCLPEKNGEEEIKGNRSKRRMHSMKGRMPKQGRANLQPPLSPVQLASCSLLLDAFAL